jgi:hypothetical protein
VPRSFHFLGTIFDFVRVAMRCGGLLVDGTEDVDFFFSSRRSAGLTLDFDEDSLMVDADEQIDEFDLRTVIEQVRMMTEPCLYLFMLAWIDSEGVFINSSFF